MPSLAKACVVLFEGCPSASRPCPAAPCGKGARRSSAPRSSRRTSCACAPRRASARRRQLLGGAGIDPSAVDNETGWVSQLAAKRALRAIAELLGRDAIRHRGEWVTHPEALGVLVRMLRASERPVDAYRYLAQNAREATRVGTWEIEELRRRKAQPDAAPSHAVRMTYRTRTDGADEARRAHRTPRARSCSATRAPVSSRACRASGAWPRPRSSHDDVHRQGRRGLRLRRAMDDAAPARGAARRRGGCGGGVRRRRGGHRRAGSPGRSRCVLGATLGGGAGFMWDRSREERVGAHLRAQPHRRARARARAARRDGRDARAISRAPCSAASTASGARSARAASAWSTPPST